MTAEMRSCFHSVPPCDDCLALMRIAHSDKTPVERQLDMVRELVRRLGWRNVSS